MTKHFGNCKYVVVLFSLFWLRKISTGKFNDAAVPCSAARTYLCKLLSLLFVLWCSFSPPAMVSFRETKNIDKWVLADLA